MNKFSKHLIQTCVSKNRVEEGLPLRCAREKRKKNPTLRRCNSKTRNANQKLFGMSQYFLIALPAHA